MATVNLGRVGFVQKGIYAQNTHYKVNDIVTRNGNLLACIQEHTTGDTGYIPENWSVWVDRNQYIGINAPTLTIPSFTVNEATVNQLPIDNFDTNVTYIVSASKGTTAIENGEVVYTAPYVSVDDVDTISIYYKVGTILSETSNYYINIVDVPTSADATIQVLDFTNTLSSNTGFNLV